MAKTKILAFAGSTRVGSYNKQLLSVGVTAMRAIDAEVTVADFRELRLPLYDQDLETSEGLPENALKLKKLMRESDGFLIAAPEYNSSLTPLLKNAIDWASRPETDEEPSLICFRGKAAALLSASPGGLGGMRGLVALRSLLGNIGMLVLPDQVSIPTANLAFDEAGHLIDDSKSKQVTALAHALVKFVTRNAQ